MVLGPSLVVQWLRIRLARVGGGVGLILVMELRSHMLLGPKKNQNILVFETMFISPEICYLPEHETKLILLQYA